MGTKINCKIYKNGDTNKPLSGYIQVLAQSLKVESDRLYLADPVTYPLVNGTVLLDLVPSDVDKVAYLFKVYETIQDDDDLLLHQFVASIPESIDPIAFSKLAQQTGLRYDLQDTSLLTLARYLTSSEYFTDFYLSKIIRHRGQFKPDTVYRKNDGVLYNGNGYIFVSNSNKSGVIPTDPSYWIEYVSRGETGAGVSGSSEPYGSSWQTSTVAPSRASIYQILETLQRKVEMSGYAPLINAVFKTPSLENPPIAGDNSNALVSSSWVNDAIYKIVPIPVGSRIKWDGTATPTGYIKADGTPKLKALYPKLFMTYGYSYTGGDNGLLFGIPTDIGFIIYTGS